MSAPPYTPLGYQADPPPPLNLPTGYSPETLARRVDAAIAAIAPEKRGRLIFSITQQRAAIDLMLRVGGPVTIVARVAKPRNMPTEAEVLLNVNFMASPDLREEAERIRTRRDLKTMDCYHALRGQHEGVKRNGRFRAFVKALAMDKLGSRPYLDGGRWFDRG